MPNYGTLSFVAIAYLGISRIRTRELNVSDEGSDGSPRSMTLQLSCDLLSDTESHRFIPIDVVADLVFHNAQFLIGE